METQQFYRKLVQRYLDGTASKEELQVFFSLLEQGVLDRYLEEVPLEMPRKASVQGSKRNPSGVFRMRIAYGIAASVMLLVVAGYFLWQSNQLPAPKTVAVASPSPQVLPGTKKAVLTLSNGDVVMLDSNQTTIQDGTVSISNKGEALVYKASAVAGPAGYNSIVTPRGGEYQLRLPDGSKVWLNAGSMLRYPTRFEGAERRVELSGEAYFEVVKNSRQPFVVQSAEAEVMVLGTHFNVIAYPDEHYMKTTLAEGAVVVRKAGTEKRLQPGEGATIEKGAGIIRIEPADVDQDLAWTKGLFHFNKTALATIMKQIGRWYDLDIEFAGAVPDKRFVGRISRHTNLSEVLAILELSGVRFTLKGKTLRVEE